MPLSKRAQTPERRVLLRQFTILALFIFCCPDVFPASRDYMVQIVALNLDKNVKPRIMKRDLLHGPGMQEEVRQLLRNAAREPNRPAFSLGSCIANRT